MQTEYLTQAKLQDQIDVITERYLASHPAFIAAAIEKDAALKNIPREAVQQVLTSYPGAIAVAVHEVAHTLHSKGDAPSIFMARRLAEAAHSRTGIDIHPGCVIGNNLFIDHGTGDVIGETAVVGNNTQIMHKVTLGAYIDPKETRPDILRYRHPVIGDNCFLAVGVEVLGHVKVGNNVVMGTKALLYGHDIKVNDDVKISTGVRIEDRCEIAKGVTIHPGAYIERGSGLIDRDIPANSTVYRDEKSGELKVIEGISVRHKQLSGNTKDDGVAGAWSI